MLAKEPFPLQKSFINYETDACFYTIFYFSAMPNGYGPAKINLKAKKIEEKRFFPR